MIVRILRIFVISAVFFGLIIPVEASAFKRDPFEPYDLNLAHKKGRKKTSLNFLSRKSRLTVMLSGIIWDFDESYAVISSQGKQKVLRLGEAFSGYKVIKITKQDVWLKNNKQTVVLTLNKKIKI